MLSRWYFCSRFFKLSRIEFYFYKFEGIDIDGRIKGLAVVEMKVKVSLNQMLELWEI